MTWGGPCKSTKMCKRFWLHEQRESLSHLKNKGKKEHVRWKPAGQHESRRRKAQDRSWVWHAWSKGKRVYVCTIQNHRMMQNQRICEGGRGLWRTSSPTLLLRQVHPEHLAQDHIGRCCISPEKESPQPLQAAYSSALSLLKKRSFPHIHTELAVFKFVPVAPCPTAGLCKNLSKRHFFLIVYALVQYLCFD